MEISSPLFWTALIEIIGVNVILSGDNAVVIALAARTLPPEQQKKAILYGSLAAIVMRVILTIVAAKLLTLPWLKITGSVLLIWIGIKLIIPEGEGEHGGAARSSSAIAAIRTILIADLVMSLDNVLAVAAAAKDSIPLLVLGLAVSIPIIIFGSTLILRLMDRFPVIITVGGALLGYVAGEMAVGDSAMSAWIDDYAHWLHYAAPAAGAVLVIAVGKWFASKVAAGAEGGAIEEVIDLDAQTRR
ncbi:MAG: TerC family protein [Betaproteobacteria bacterium]|nr:TerC family protein [Betaproteobacteria bacterium]